MGAERRDFRDFYRPAAVAAWVIVLLALCRLGSTPVGAEARDPGAAGIGCEPERVLRATRPPVTGNDVLELRSRLRNLGYESGDPKDDRYDAGLAAVVARWQQDAGLIPDGVVGPLSWAALADGVAEPVVAPASSKPEGEVSIVIDVDRLTLTVYSDGQPFKTYPVAVGRAHWLTLTPVGEWRVIHKGLNWGGGFGTRWIGLNVPWGIYGIHGTNKPYSIGTRASAGCVRMFNRDVEELYPWVPIGTSVRIVGSRPAVVFDRELKQGATGPDVVELQLRLNEAGFVHGDADGRFGPATESALRALQRTYGLPEDGVAWSDVYYVLGLKDDSDG